MMNYATCPFKIDDLITKDAEYGKTGVFSGYASTFGNRDRDNDIIDKGAFGQVDPSTIRMLAHHDMREPIGVWKQISEDQHGLPVRGEINLEVQRGREIYSLMKQGALGDMSIGFKVPRGGTYDKEIGEGESKTRVRHIKTIKLFEISIVSVPANPMARITQVKSASDMPTLREFECLLRDAGHSRKERAELAHEYKALLGKCGLVERDADDREEDDAIARDAEAAKKAADEAAKKAADDLAADEAQKAAQQALDAIKSIFSSALADLNTK